MKRVLLFSLFPFLVTILLCDPAEIIASNKPGNLLQRQDIKLGFIENKGQIIDQKNNPNPSVLYLLNTPCMNVQLRKAGFSYDLYSRTSSPSLLGEGPGVGSSIINYNRIDIDLVNANPNPAIETSAPSSDYLNFYTTGTPVAGITSVRSYTSVTYKDIYPGIDLQFKAGNDRPFEYNFILQPGADISSIKLKVYGPEKIKSYQEGLRCETSLGDIDETIPVCYYRINDIQVPVRGRFRKIAEHLYGFATDQAIPAGAVLLIDPIPTRRWGTYYGSSIIMNVGCATDSLGNVCICGFTGDLIHIATAGAFQPVLDGLQDAFLVKFSTTGQRLWGTYYGGSSDDFGYSCATDRSGNIFLVGYTDSNDGIATPGAWQTIRRGQTDAFVAKFTSAGMRIWGTYYGGDEVPPQGDILTACATDTLGNVYCAGTTTSPDFISSPGAGQPNIGGGVDGFLVKLTGDGQRAWATYYGGSNWEQDICCTVSKKGFVYLSGSTNSSNNIATPGSFMSVYPGGGKAFLACFNLDGQRFWGTYFGGNGGTGDKSSGCMADTGSNVYLYGNTTSNTNIATTGVYQPASPTGGGYLEKFSSSGSRLLGTYYGHSELEGAAVDDSGFVYIAGFLNSQDTMIASPHAYQTFNRGGQNALLAKLTGTGQRIWGTYYGGTDSESGIACAVDHSDNIYLCGNATSVNNTSNTGFCTRDPYKNIIASPDGLYTELYYMNDGYLVKFADCYSPDTALQINGPSSLCQNTTGIVYSIDSIPTAAYYTWCVNGDLTITAGQHTTSITVDVGSILGVDTISVYGINACDTGFPKVITRRVFPRPIPFIAGSDTTCAGIINLFTTEGGKTNYQWTISTGGTITSGGTATDSACSVSWNTGGTMWIKVSYTDTTGCISQNPTQFNVWVNPGPLTSVSITSSLNLLCAGISVNYTATPVNGGSTPVYQWNVNGINVGTNSSTWSYTPANGDTVACRLTSSLTGCLSGNPATSNSIIMIVNQNSPVSLTITPSGDPVCAGNTVTFTATPTNGGLSPSYQWKVNASNAGTNSPTYSYIPNNGDIVTCVLTSNAICPTGNPATSNAITMTVNPNLPVSIMISASANPFCQGSSVTFTATPVNGGGSPGYQWQINGVNIGINTPNYTYNPLNGDLVTCILSSSIACPVGSPATSNTITMLVNSNLSAGVTIIASSNPFCPGSSVTFTATPINGGTTPSYQWKVNGVNAGTNSHTFTYNPTNGDSVRCIMTSNLSCVTGNPATSADIIMSGTLAPIVTFTACFDTITTVNAKPIKLKGGIPLGGTYSGPGVNSSTGIFNPATAGVGTKTITYSYTNAANCTALANIHIINYPLSIVNCGSPITDIRDNKVYPTVQLGSQCWLSANLNYGTIIASTQDQRDNCISEKYCYNDNPVNCTSQGGLYQWDELMQYDATPGDQGFCPPDWHIPTENDWNTLFANYVSNAFAGSPLKYSGYSGFNALLSGARHIDKSWDFQGFATFFWSSSSYGEDKAWAYGMNDLDPSISLYPSSKANAFSVRCIHD